MGGFRVSDRFHKQDDSDGHGSKVQPFSASPVVDPLGLHDRDSDDFGDQHKKNDQDYPVQDGHCRGDYCAHCGSAEKESAILSFVLSALSNPVVNFSIGLLLGMYAMQSALLEAFNAIDVAALCK